MVAVLAYVKAVILGVDVLVNALLGGAAYTTMSCRIGLSILDDGWAAKVPWPNWWRQHCLDAVFETTV